MADIATDQQIAEATAALVPEPLPDGTPAPDTGETDSSPPVVVSTAPEPPQFQPTPIPAGQEKPPNRTFRWEICLRSDLALGVETKLVLEVYSRGRLGSPCPTRHVTRGKLQMAAPLLAQWRGGAGVEGETGLIRPVGGVDSSGRRFEWFLTPRDATALNVHVYFYGWRSHTFDREREPLSFSLDGPQGVPVGGQAGSPPPDPAATTAKTSRTPIELIVAGVVAGVAGLFALLRKLTEALGDMEKVIKFVKDNRDAIRSLLGRLRFLPAAR